MQLNKPFSLAAVLGAETSAAQDEDHWVLPLQFGELPVLPGVVGKFIVGENSPWNHVGSHINGSSVMMRLRARRDIRQHIHDAGFQPRKPTGPGGLRVPQELVATGRLLSERRHSR